jgi:hypothetical protein
MNFASLHSNPKYDHHASQHLDKEYGVIISPLFIPLPKSSHVNMFYSFDVYHLRKCPFLFLY